MGKPLLHLVYGLTLACLLPASLHAQTLQDRITHMQRKLAERQAQDPAAQTQSRARRDIGQVELVDVAAREAFDWLRQTAKIDIVVPWARLEEAGISPDQKVSLTGRNLTPATALNQLLRQLSDTGELLWEVEDGYIEVMTREQANQRAVVRVYPVGDLLLRVPNFQGPELDLQQMTQSRGSFGGGASGGASGSGGLFQGDQREDEKPLTRQERAEQIADVIRQSIEPDLWRENGGQYGSIRFLNDNMVIRAPMYVHRKIGGESRMSGSAASASSPQAGRYVTLNADLTRTGQGVAADVQGIVVHRPPPSPRPVRREGFSDQSLYPRRHSPFGVEPVRK